LQSGGETQSRASNLVWRNVFGDVLEILAKRSKHIRAHVAPQDDLTIGCDRGGDVRELEAGLNEPATDARAAVHPASTIRHRHCSTRVPLRVLAPQRPVLLGLLRTEQGHETVLASDEPTELLHPVPFSMPPLPRHVRVSGPDG
jgi:hypothetical protein